jgi:hypothetical protein
LAKNGLGYILGDYFTNAFGHPVEDVFGLKNFGAAEFNLNQCLDLKT